MVGFPRVGKTPSYSASNAQKIRGPAIYRRAGYRACTSARCVERKRARSIRKKEEEKNKGRERERERGASNSNRMHAGLPEYRVSLSA